MAGKAVIGALRVTLGLDSAQFQQGLTKAQAGMARFASMARTGALAVGAAMVTGAGVMAGAMKGIIDDADQMSKLAQSIGIPIEELSKLRYAADLAGVDLDSLGKAIKRLSAGMLDSTESGTGPAARSFAMLGVSVRDAAGNMRPATAVMEDLAGKFARMPNGVEKTALAMRIFGKSGADMIPLLNSGATGLREMYEEAEELGLVLDEQTGRAAEDFNDNLTRMGRIKDGIVTKITAAMLPAMANLSDALVVASKNSGLMNAIGLTLGWTLKALATAAVTAGGFFIALAQDIALAADVSSKWARGAMVEATVALTMGNARRERTLNSIREINSAIWAPQTGGLDRPPSAAGLDLIDTSSDSARRSVQRLTDAEREAKRAAEELAREGERVFEQTRTPAEQYAATVERLTRMLNAAAISQDTFNRAMADAQRQFEQDDPAKQALRSLEEKKRQFAMDSAQDRMDLAADHEAELQAATYDGIRGGLEAAADGNLGQYLAMRIRSALLDNLAGTLTDLFLGKGKGSGGGMMGSLSGIMGSLRSIPSVLRGVGFPGFATGGSFKVGGAPGKDKNFVGMNLTKGEMVDIRRPGQGMGGGIAVHVSPSPYFDVAVEQIAAPMAMQAAVGAVSVQNTQARHAQRRQRQRFV